MAENTPPGPKTSGRVAGVVAIAAILVGGYYGLVAKPASTTATSSDAAPAAAGAKPPEAAPAATDAAAKPADAAAKPAESAATDATKTPAAPAAASADAKTEATAPAKEEAVPSETSAPSFDIVRVEPTGETVVAGLAAPKSKVELLDGAAPIATAEANERGEWAMAVEKPLAPGTHDLSIRTTSADKKIETLSEQSVAVQVPESGKGQALVVLNTPDAASKILQKPDAQGETKVAAAAPDATAPQIDAPKADAPKTDATVADAASAAPAPDAAAQAAKAGEPAASSDAAASKPATPDAAGQAVAAAPDAAAKPDTTVAADATAKPDTTKPDATAKEEAPAATDTLADADKAAKPDATVAAAAPAPADAATANKSAATTDGKTADTKTANAAAPAAEPKVTVDAVEVEGGKTFVAGSAKTNAPVRVYVDDKPIGQAKPGEGGRWLLETPNAIEPGRRVVRADQLETDSGKVVARAEVPFERTADVAVLAPVVAGGGGAGGASADGNVPSPQNVIIRRGDNLWSISRRLYGRGVRFSTIYEANNDQIRNPDLIYPGQTFVLPAGDSSWTN